MWRDEGCKSSATSRNDVMPIIQVYDSKDALDDSTFDVTLRPSARAGAAEQQR